MTSSAWRGIYIYIYIYVSIISIFISMTRQPSTLTRLRCSACECGLVRWTESPHERIVNGDEAPAHAYPWQISLFSAGYSQEFYDKIITTLEQNNAPTQLIDGVKELKEKDMPRHSCGGSIISPFYIFTAG